jgi:hypothetical protein
LVKDRCRAEVLHFIAQNEHAHIGRQVDQVIGMGFILFMRGQLCLGS